MTMKSLSLLLAAGFAGSAFALSANGVFGTAELFDRTAPGAMALAIEGRYLYGGAGDWFVVFDLSDPLKPRKVGAVRGVGAARQAVVRKGFAYVTSREYGLWIVDVTDPAKPRIRSRFDTCELATGVDVAGDVCFCGQRQNGVEFIDVSDPDHPRHIAMRKTDESQSVVYRDGWLYSGEWGRGRVTVFDAHDMSNIRPVAWPELYGYGDGVWLQGDYLYAARGHHSLHRKVTGGIAISEDDKAKSGSPDSGYGMGHGLDIFDIRDPKAPRRVGAVDYPPFYARGLDMWTPRTSGNLLFAAQTHNGLFAVSHCNVYAAIRVIVLDCVIAQVVDDAVQNPRDAVQHRFFTGERQRNRHSFRRDLYAVHSILGNLIEIDVLPLHLFCAAVQSGQSDDVLDKLRHALRLLPNFARKRANVLCFNHIALEKLRIAGDRMERRFQLVGGIRSKFLTDLRGFFQLFLVAPDLRLLCAHFLKQRLDLLILLSTEIGGRRIGIDPVDRLDDFFRQSGRQNQRNGKSDQSDDGNGLRKPEDQRPKGILHAGKTQHRSIRQQLRGVKQLFRQRLRIAAAFPVSGFKRFLHFLALQMVPHIRTGGLVVVENRAVGGNPCDAVVSAA